ncbi:hypothetical protein BCF74_12119 [Knoellia remsis]|uniref:Secreted protein n=1 Tax=Knoellia remsis TaxID=407159 RepID=A0A2T0UD73_9MICO|nr:DUF5719 family protein [Knoellia remsis]PRY55842.1 hypothetical protein BCF74_12119 [Knoellia remsis]
MNRAQLLAPGRLALTAAGAAGLVALATLAPADGAPTGPQGPQGEGASLAPVSSASTTCPGPELSGVRDVDDIEVAPRLAVATAPQSMLSVTPGGASGLAAAGQKVTPPPERGAATSLPLAANRPATVEASGALAPGLAAGQEWVSTRPELRGLATVPCAAPGADLWLLAGGGAPGRQERLVLTNPGANEVTVDLEVLGRKGPVATPTGGTVVPAGGRTALLVDAVTGAEESPAIRVRATGGSVRAVLSDIWLDGSTPVGAETSLPTAKPATRQVIPAAAVGTSGSLRIAVPGEQQAVVSARILGKDGPVPVPGGGVARVSGRSTGELPLTGLKGGTYAVEVTSDVPVVASLWSTGRVGSGLGDFVWGASTEPAAGLVGGAFPRTEGVTRTVSVVASRAPATAELAWLTGGQWRTRSLALAQDTGVTVELGAAEAVFVRRSAGSGDVRAGVVSMAGVPGARLVSVSPLVAAAEVSRVSRAHPMP